MFTHTGTTSSSMPPLTLPSIHAPEFSRDHQVAAHQHHPRDEETTTLPPLRNIAESPRHRCASLVSVEHERTRQERLKLERYKVKRDMLRDLLHAGVHPDQIPQFFSDIDQTEDLPTSHSEVSPRGSSQTNSISRAAHAPRVYPSPPSSYSPRSRSNPHDPTSWQSNGAPKQPSSLAALTVDRNRPQPPIPFPNSSHTLARANSIPSASYSDLAAATNHPAFVTDSYAISPRALQFKFYKPGPKQKVLRRKRGSAAAPQNGVSKDQSRRQVRGGSQAGSSGSLAGTGLGSHTTSPKPSGSISPAESQRSREEGRRDAAMSDAEDESDEDVDDSGSEVG